MFVLAVAILIVYGLALIFVQGTIFNGLRGKLADSIKARQEYFAPTNEEIVKLIEASHRSINKKLLSLYKELESKIATAEPTDASFDKLMSLFHEAFNKIRVQVIKKRHTLFKRFMLWADLKFEKLWGCMMCSSFWIGWFVCVFSMIFSISICGIPFNLVTAGHSAFITTFLLSGLFSGTTWAIHAVVDTLDEIKENLGDIISKR